MYRLTHSPPYELGPVPSVHLPTQALGPDHALCLRKRELRWARHELRHTTHSFPLSGIIQGVLCRWHVQHVYVNPNPCNLSASRHSTERLRATFSPRAHIYLRI